ncbi:MAG: hypothetical protein GOMPHAMPRED_006115 [Gomphillus americanus]|uniref:LysM domain-containing protein n=1 Tax=Gomphillus americanus TaxID=1940652 RepID=A0A8H3EMF2_9LECA|nr:MAG: hypothetical protein GOMPHAMPRED_006115 [Gomphillus americanus]
MVPSQNHATSTTSSLRPRNRRLISIEDGEQPLQQNIELDPGLRSAPLAEGYSSSSLHPPRAISPSSSIFRSTASNTRKASSRTQTVETGATRKWGLAVPTPSSATFLFSPKYWEDSWSSLQDVATTLLGTDSSKSRRPSASLQSKYPHTSSKYGVSIEDEWGPVNIESRIAAGSQEDRLAEIQARKRQILLTANGHNRHDARGKHKRKLSVDDTEVTVAEQTEDALVYVHPVQPTDTVMGVAIKYGCQESVVRKANRLWANDSMQLRRLAYIPVNACSVRGQKISAPTTLLKPEQESNRDVPLSIPNSSTDWSIPTTPKATDTQQDSLPSPSASATTTSYDITVPHIHESWVQISGFLTSTEVARLPRRTLGFFPPTRRKSTSYHDATPSSANSPILSPSESLPNNIKRAISPALHLPPMDRYSRGQVASSTKSPNTIAATLHGPGGVGSLGYEARAPGPAQDKLNTFFATHFPNAVPALVPPVAAGFPSSRNSFESIRSGVSTPGGSGGLEQIGGKVETWVRKLAAKGMRDLASGNGSSLGSRRGSAGQLVNMEVQGDGDLIELVGRIDSMAINDGLDEPIDSSGRDTSKHSTNTTASDLKDDQTLRERFPVGGRLFESITK